MGCATPQYALRPAPQPVETPDVLQIERAISAQQAADFARQGARPLREGEILWGFEPQAVLERLARVTERPGLPYQAYLYQGKDPNAASLADGRVYVSTGMLAYLAGRSRGPDELASVLAHELAHTTAQHLVKRYQTLQQQQVLLSLVNAGISAATRSAGATAQGVGQLALNAAALLRDVANSGYSQDQELEADQLGLRYLLRAGYDPRAALTLLEDFARFETPWPFLRTHPYSAQRRAYLEQYLRETGASAGSGAQERIAQLRRIQQSYPPGSVSWQNLQRQIEALEN
ncbi:MAG: M48 family metalloprotease [Candidatus Omnitrophica bacterium]|nr:M48 family metalloprotease [Candidatus Omnitrophota bacterium]